MTPHENEIWTKLKSVLFAAPAKQPDREEFIVQVMSKLPASRSNPAWGGAWWKIPALAVSALAILVLGPRMDINSSSPSAILLSDASSEQAQSLFYQSRVETDDLFTLLMEESPS